jgi:ligand-binding sensor domain-containing protein/class 3 adenylate cyclase
MKRRLFSIIAVSVLCLQTWALPMDFSLSQLVMDAWNDRSGLPSNSVLDVLQDNKGYIWIASYDGLIRFDGRSFTVFTKESATGFDSNSARVLACAKDGTLWIGTNTDGLFSYKDGTFHAYGKQEGLPDLSVRALGFDIFGKLWVGTAGGIAFLDGEGFRFFSAGDGIPSFFLPLSDGSMLVGSNKPGLWKTGAASLVPMLADQNLPKAAMFAAAIDAQNQLWLGAGDGTVLVVRGNEVVRRLEIPELKGSSVNRFLPDSDGTMWIASDKGLFYGSGDSYRRFSEDNGLPNNSVTALVRDREGSFWAGLARGGVVKFSPGKFFNLTQLDGLAGNAVNAVMEDQYGSLWVASDQGLAFFPDKTDPYAADPLRKKAVDKVLADLGKIRVRQIRLDRRNVLWFATYSDWGLYTFDGQRSASITQKDGLPVNRVRLSLEDSQGRLWVGTTAGLVLRDAAGFRTFGKAQGLRTEFILDVHEDAAKNIWVGLDGGGMARWEANGGFTSWTTTEGLVGNVVFRFFTDSKDRLWICTSDGLSLFEDGKFTNFGARDGLLSDSVYQMLQEPMGGKFWLVTSRGLAVMAPDTLILSTGTINRSTVRVLDRLDGLAGQPTANSWAFRNARGMLYFPTIGGLSVYNPQSVSPNPIPPPVYLESISQDGMARNVPAAGWTVQPGTQRVIFKFTALSFMVPQKVGFRYRLEGYDSQWIGTGTGERSAVYTNLPPGDYIFRVQAWNNDGVVNEAGAATSFTVAPSFWQTIWFYLACAIALVGLGFGLNLVRTRAITRRKAELERLVTERTDALNLEKQKSEALLLNVLPATVAEELKTTGHAEPQEHADVAVLFADLVGFTEISSGMTPAQTIAELNMLFSTFDDIVGLNGCERIKTVGDAYLAVAGLDGSGSARDRATRLVRAAREMLLFLENRRGQATVPWQLRIGIHCGPVVGGVVGVKKYIYDIFGDTVNTASRMQTESQPGRTTVSARTAELLGPGFPLESRGQIQIKGKGGMELFFVL